MKTISATIALMCIATFAQAQYDAQDRSQPLGGFNRNHGDYSRSWDEGRNGDVRPSYGERERSDSSYGGPFDTDDSQRKYRKVCEGDSCSFGY
jgi:hypothetical protein